MLKSRQSVFSRAIVMNTKKLLLVLVLGAWIAAGSLAYAQYGTPSGTQANTVSNVTVPAGTAISVRTNEAVDSRNASEGQTFSAAVVDDVKGSSGEILIPKNSNAQLVIRKVATGGTTGSPELTLDLNSVTVNGRNYIVSTADVNKQGNSGIGKNKRTAEMVGGGAVLGTLLGAIAGGGKGAVIGAVAGAAAGGTAQVLTKGKEVKVPAETVLKFQLDQPVTLTASY
jgi:outer membrane lipoprotein SlyB